MSPAQLRLLAASIERGRLYDFVTDEEKKAILLALRFHAELLETTRA